MFGEAAAMNDSRESMKLPPKSPQGDHLERLIKQSAHGPERLVVRDQMLNRLLAVAGSGGSY